MLQLAAVKDVLIVGTRAPVPGSTLLQERLIDISARSDFGDKRKLFTSAFKSTGRPS